METKIKIMKYFFEDPTRVFYIRELSRISKINHTTVRQSLIKLEEDGFLVSKKGGVVFEYKAKMSEKFLNLKLFYNFEKLRESGIVNDLQRFYDFPVVVLFGSYCRAEDVKGSDVDICVVSNIKKVFPVEKYEKVLGRKVSVHLFSEKDFERAKERNLELVNSICNGIVFSGELRVLK